MAKLPSVTSSIPRDLQQFILRVKETLEGTGPDAMVSARQLIAAGIAEGVGNGGITAPVSDVVDPPRAPTGVSAAGALATIIVSWNSPAYRGHAYSEIWAASRTQAQTDATPPENPIIGQAELVGMTAGNNFSHNLGSGAQRWYWVRFVNRSGVAGPYNLTAGTFGQTSQDPEYMLEVLTDAVTSSQLASTLLANINTTFSQASAPTQKADGTALVAGDLWYDTDDGNKLYRYDGAQWVNAQDGGIAQAIADAGGAQGTADGKITTYYQDASPTNQQGTLNEGDLWVDTDDGNNLYRWNNTTSQWVDIQDDGIGTAIQDASDAQSTADKKTITFFQDNEPTTSDEAELGLGDLWVDTDDGNQLYRYQYVTVDGQQVLQWVTVRDAGIQSALDNAATAQSTADGKILTFYQDDAPTINDNADLSLGDIWFDTDDGRKIHRYQVTGQDENGDVLAWVAVPDSGIAQAIQDAADAQSTADKKTITFFQNDAPTTSDDAELGLGDLWVDTNDGNKLYRYQYATVNGQQVLQWVTVRDGGIQSALDNAATAQSTADGKILTFYQDDAPTINDNADLGFGDIWFDTNNGRKMYRYQVTGQNNGVDVYEWVAIPDAAIAQAIQDAADAQSTADGKITSYYQNDEPTNANGELSEGDLWTDTDDNDSTYRWDDDGGQNGTGEWVRIGLASFTDVNTAITDQVGYCELSIVAGGSTTKSVSTANTTQTLCQAAQADANKPSNYTYAWKSDGAIASELKTVTSSVGSNTASIQTNVESIDGIEANFTVKTDVGGHISGFGLLNTARDATPTSEFGVRADKFFIAPPSTASNIAPTTNLFKGKVWVDTSTTPSVVKYYDPTANSNTGGWTTTQITNLPFIVNTTPTTINGQSVPAGAYMDTAFIADATITQAQIGTLNADVINSGLLNTVDFYGNTIAGASIYLGGTVTYNTDSAGNNIGIASIATPQVAMTSTGANFATGAFVINDGTTNYTPFQVVGGVAYLNNAMIKDSTLSFAKVSDDIQSSDYKSAVEAGGPAGWKIAKGGEMEMTNATFRGALDIDAGSGSRLTINDEKIEVFDGSSLRVRIGKLN